MLSPGLKFGTTYYFRHDADGNNAKAFGKLLTDAGYPAQTFVRSDLSLPLYTKYNEGGGASLVVTDPQLTGFSALVADVRRKLDAWLDTPALRHPVEKVVNGLTYEWSAKPALRKALSALGREAVAMDVKTIDGQKQFFAAPVAGYSIPDSARPELRATQVPISEEPDLYFPYI